MITVISFSIASMFTIALGLYVAFNNKKDNSSDYYLASQSINPLVAGISLNATNFSGVMFMGFIGTAYVQGFWLITFILGLWLGDFIASHFVFKMIRSNTSMDSYSYISVIDNINNTNSRRYRAISGVMAVVCLSIYLIAQMFVCSKALGFIFHISAPTAILTAGLFLGVYCWIGGIRASIMTDVTQFCLMFFAIGIVFVFLFYKSYDTGGLLHNITLVEQKGFLKLHNSDSALGILTFIVGAIGGGFANIAMPQAIARVMAVNNITSVSMVRFWYYFIGIPFSVMSIFIGIGLRTMIPIESVIDPDVILLNASQLLMGPIITGIILSGIFAGVLSTSDSLVISISSTICNDVFNVGGSYKCNRAATVIAICVIAFITLVIDFYSRGNIFALGNNARFAMGGCFTAILLLLSWGYRFNSYQLLATSAVGFIAVILCHILNYDKFINIALAGILASNVTYFVMRHFSYAGYSGILMKNQD